MMSATSLRSDSRPLAPAFPLPRPAIILVCLIAPIWGSTILYFLWRGSHPEAARYANRCGWLIFMPLVLVGVIARLAAPHGDGANHRQPTNTPAAKAPGR